MRATCLMARCGPMRPDAACVRVRACVRARAVDGDDVGPPEDYLRSAPLRPALRQGAPPLSRLRAAHADAAGHRHPGRHHRHRRLYPRRPLCPHQRRVLRG
eukprot:2952753-Prymnesium_polylepis.1